MRKIILGEPILLGRGKDGKAFALRDICPHRGMPLAGGRVFGAGDQADNVPVNETQVECPYHGWRFRTDGACAAIPALCSDDSTDTTKIRIRNYPVKESQGLIWIYMSDKPLEGPQVEADGEPALPAPVIPLVGERAPGMVITMTYDCHVDHAAIGFIDPAHVPFVHRSWWWRSGSSMHNKEKRFGPAPMGFKMLPHKPSKNAFFYKLLGGEMTTEISFQLPALRTELIQIGKRSICGITVATPIDETHTEVSQIFWWTVPWLTPLKPVLSPLGHVFLAQDRDVINKQKEGLKFNPRLMLVKDPDAQARWYEKLKKAWTHSCETGETFKNPVTEEVTLRWRS